MRVRFLIAYLCTYFIFPPNVWAEVIQTRPQQQEAQAQVQIEAQVPQNVPAVGEPLLAAPAAGDNSAQEALKKKKEKDGPSDREILRQALHKASWRIGAVAKARIPGLLEFRPSENHSLFRPYKDCKNPFSVSPKEVKPSELKALLAEAQNAWVAFVKGREAELATLEFDRNTHMGQDQFPKAMETVVIDGKKCQPSFFVGKGVLVVDPSEEETLGKILKMVNDEGKSILSPPMTFLMATDDDARLTTLELRESVLILQGLRTWTKLYNDHVALHGGEQAVLPDLVVPESLAIALKSMITWNLVEEIDRKIRVKQPQEAARVEELAPRFVLCSKAPSVCGVPKTTSVYGENDYCFCDAKEERLRKMDLAVMQELIPGDPENESTPHWAYLSAVKKLGIKGLIFELATINSMLPASMKFALPTSILTSPELAYYVELFNDLNTLPERMAWVEGFTKAVDTLVANYEEGALPFPLPQTDTEFYSTADSLARSAVSGGAPGDAQDSNPELVAKRQQLQAAFRNQQLVAQGVLAYVPFEDRIAEGDRVLGQDFATHFGKKLRILSHLYQESMERLESSPTWKTLSHDQKEKHRFEILTGIAKEALSDSYSDALYHFVLSLFDNDAKEHMELVWESDYAPRWKKFLGSKAFAPTLDKISKDVATAIMASPEYNPPFNADVAAADSARHHVRHWAPMALEAARVEQARRVLLRNAEGLQLSTAFAPGVSGLGWVNPWNSLNYRYRESFVTDVSQVPACFQDLSNPELAKRYPYFGLDPVSPIDVATGLVSSTSGKDYEHLRRGLVAMLDRKANVEKFVEYLKSKGYTDQWVSTNFTQELPLENGKPGEVRVLKVHDVRTLAYLILDRFKTVLEADSLKDPGASAKVRRQAFQPLRQWLMKGDLSKKAYTETSKRHAEALFDRYLLPVLKSENGSASNDERAYVSDILAKVHAREIMVGRPNVDQLLVGYAGYRAGQEKIERVFEALNEPLKDKGEIRTAKGLDGPEAWVNFCKTYNGKHTNCEGWVDFVTGPLGSETVKRVFEKRVKLGTLTLIEQTKFHTHFHPGGRVYNGEETLHALEKESKVPPKAAAEVQKAAPAVPAGVTEAELAGEALKAAKTVRMRLMRQLYYGYDASEFPFPAESLPTSKEGKRLLTQIDGLLSKISKEKPKEDYTDEEKEADEEKKKDEKSALGSFLEGVGTAAADPDSYLKAVTFYLKPTLALQELNNHLGQRRADAASRRTDNKWVEKTVGNFITSEKVFENWLARRNADVASLKAAISKGDDAMKASFPTIMILVKQTPELLLGSGGVSAADWAREEYMKRLPKDLLPTFEVWREEVTTLMVQLEGAGDMSPNAEVAKLEKELAEAEFAKWSYLNRQRGSFDWLETLPESVGNTLGTVTGKYAGDKAGEQLQMKEFTQNYNEISERLSRAQVRRDQWQRLQRLLALYMPEDSRSRLAMDVLTGEVPLQFWSTFFSKQFLHATKDASGAPLTIKARSGVETPVSLSRVVSDLNEIAEVSRALVPVSPQVADAYLEDVANYCAAARTNADVMKSLESAYWGTLRAELWSLLRDYKNTCLLLSTPDSEDEKLAGVRATFARLKRIWNMGERTAEEREQKFPALLNELLAEAAKLGANVKVGESSPEVEAQRQKLGERIASLGFPAIASLCAELEKKANSVRSEITPFKEDTEKRKENISEGKELSASIPRVTLAKYWEEVAVPATDLFHGPLSQFGPFILTAKKNDATVVDKTVWFRHAPTGNITDLWPTVGRVTDAFIAKALGEMVLSPAFTAERLGKIFSGVPQMANKESAKRIAYLNSVGVDKRQELYNKAKQYFESEFSNPETRPSDVSTLLGPLTFADTTSAPGASSMGISNGPLTPGTPVQGEVIQNAPAVEGAPDLIDEAPGEGMPAPPAVPDAKPKAANEAPDLVEEVPDLVAEIPETDTPASEPKAMPAPKAAEVKPQERDSKVPMVTAGQPPAVGNNAEKTQNASDDKRTPTRESAAALPPSLESQEKISPKAQETGDFSQLFLGPPGPSHPGPDFARYATDVAGAPMAPATLPPPPITQWLQTVKEAPMTYDVWLDRMEAYLRVWDRFKNSLELSGSSMDRTGTVGHRKLTALILETFLAHTHYRLDRHHLYLEAGVVSGDELVSAETAHFDPMTQREVYGPNVIAVDSLRASLLKFSRYSSGERYYIIEDVRSLFEAQKQKSRDALQKAATQDNELRAELRLKAKKLEKVVPRPFETGPLGFTSREKVTDGFAPFAAGRQMDSEAQVLELYSKYFAPSQEQIGSNPHEGFTVASLDAWTLFCIERQLADRPVHTLDKNSRGFRFAWGPAGQPLHQTEYFDNWLKDLASDPVAIAAFDRRIKSKVSTVGVRLWAGYDSMDQFRLSPLYAQMKGLIALSDQNARATAETGTYAYFLGLLNWNLMKHGSQPEMGPASKSALLWDSQKAGLMNELVSFYRWNTMSFEGWKDVLHRWGSNEEWLEIATSKKHFLMAVGDRRFGATNVDATVLPGGKLYLPTPVHAMEQSGFGVTDEAQYRAWIGDPRSYLAHQLEKSRTGVQSVAEQMAMAQGEVASLWNVKEKNPLVRDRRQIAEAKGSTFRFGEGYSTLDQADMEAVILRARALGIATNDQEIAPLHKVREAWADFRRIADSYRTAYDPKYANHEGVHNKIPGATYFGPTGSLESLLAKFKTQLDWKGEMPDLRKGPTGDPVANAIFWAGKMASDSIQLGKDERDTVHKRELLAVLSGHFTEGALAQEFYRGVLKVGANIEQKLEKLGKLDTHVDYFNEPKPTVLGDIAGAADWARRKTLSVVGYETEEYKSATDVLLESEIAMHDGITEIVNGYLQEGNANPTYRALQQLRREKRGWALWRDRLSFAAQVGLIGSVALSAGKGKLASKAVAIGFWFSGGLFAIEGIAEVDDVVRATPQRLKLLASIRDTRFQGYMSLMKDDSALVIDSAYEESANDQKSVMGWAFRTWLLAQAWTMTITPTWKFLRTSARWTAQKWYGADKYITRNSKAGWFKNEPKQAGMSVDDMSHKDALNILGKRSESRLMKMLGAEENYFGNMVISKKAANYYRRYVEARLKMIEKLIGPEIAEYRAALLEIRASLLGDAPTLSMRELQTLHLGSGALEEAAVLQPLWQRFLGVPEEVYFLFSPAARSLSGVRGVVSAEANMSRFLRFDRLRLFAADNEKVIDDLFTDFMQTRNLADAPAGTIWSKDDMLAALFDDNHKLSEPLYKYLNRTTLTESAAGETALKEADFASELAMNDLRIRINDFRQLWMDAGLPIDPKHPEFRELIKAYTERNMKRVARFMSESNATTVSDVVDLALVERQREEAKRRDSRQAADAQEKARANRLNFENWMAKQQAIADAAETEAARLARPTVVVPEEQQLKQPLLDLILEKSPENTADAVKFLLARDGGLGQSLEIFAFRIEMQYRSLHDLAVQIEGSTVEVVGRSVDHVLSYAKAARHGLPLNELEAGSQLFTRHATADLRTLSEAGLKAWPELAAFPREEISAVLGTHKSVQLKLGAGAEYEKAAENVLKALSEVPTENAPEVARLVSRWRDRVLQAKHAAFRYTAPPQNAQTPFYANSGTDLMLGAPPLGTQRNLGSKLYTDSFRAQVLEQTPAAEKQLMQRLLNENMSVAEIEKARAFWKSRTQGLADKTDVLAPNQFMAESNRAVIDSAYDRLLRLAREASDQLAADLPITLTNSGTSSSELSALGANQKYLFAQDERFNMLTSFDEAASYVGVRSKSTPAQVREHLDLLANRLAGMEEGPWKARAIARLNRARQVLQWEPKANAEFQAGLASIRQGLAGDAAKYVDDLIERFTAMGHPAEMLQEITTLRNEAVFEVARGSTKDHIQALNRVTWLMRGELRLHLAEANGVKDLATVRANFQKWAASDSIRFQFDAADSERFITVFGNALRNEVVTRSGETVANEIGKILDADLLKTTEGILKAKSQIESYLGELPEGFVTGSQMMRMNESLYTLHLTRRPDFGLEGEAFRAGQGLPFEFLTDPAVLADANLRRLVWNGHQPSADLAAALFADDAAIADGHSLINIAKQKSALKFQETQLMRDLQEQASRGGAAAEMNVHSREAHTIHDISQRHEWYIQQYTRNADARRMRKALDRLNVPQAEQQKLSRPMARPEEAAAGETPVLQPPKSKLILPGDSRFNLGTQAE